MPSLVSRLSKAERRELLDDLNYLNLAEIKAFCKKRSIPFSIFIETAKHECVRTREDDRKGVILSRIRAYLETGRVGEATCFPADVVCLDSPPPKNLQATDRLFYGHYNKKSDAMTNLLRTLTGGRFKNGAIARILAREFWSKGIAPTYQEYAVAWLEAQENHKRPNPEWAFLSDRTDGKVTPDWKRLREQKARKVIRVLNELAQQDPNKM
jgi:hypothetical protein